MSDEVVVATPKYLLASGLWSMPEVLSKRMSTNAKYLKVLLSYDVGKESRDHYNDYFSNDMSLFFSIKYVTFIFSSKPQLERCMRYSE